MSAELLREAAALMRERAEAAIQGPWEIREGYDFTLVSVGSDWPNGSDDAFGQLYGGSDARHIASWHPAVAIAVADWLEHDATAWEMYEKEGAWFPRARGERSLSVARAYLGTSDRSRPEGSGTPAVTGAQPDEPASQAGRPVGGGS